MSKVSPVKGTRDFYPEQMAIRNWILDGWKASSIRNGFLEYDGPIFEHLQLFTQKSGEGIASELFSFTDRGDRAMAIRPEMTPTLARMVNQQINALPRPIKWFSMPRCCRAEKPQKGRLREFFQWNVDIIGPESVLADAECIFTAVDYLRSVGLKPDDIQCKLSSRKMLALLLEDQGFSEDELEPLYVLLDKRPKLSDAAFSELLEKTVPDAAKREKMMAIQALKSVDEIDELATGDAAKESVAELRELFNFLDSMGIGQYCTFDISIVRGLAYYTGPVFEIHDMKGSLRAVCGGGRYDNLLAGLGGQKVTGTGFGMGDVVLEILLTERGLLDVKTQNMDFFIIDADKERFEDVLKLTFQLRSRGYSASFSYKRAAIGKQFKQATTQNARFSIIIEPDFPENSNINIKNLADGSQHQYFLEEFLADPTIAMN
ncbi:MAG: histidine--tRNA ligase [Phycisphaerae bacterium]|nr:histidine--tRNA ligase [Phycisphaerae bacterium]